MADLKIIGDANTSLDTVQRGLGLTEYDRRTADVLMEITQSIVKHQEQLRYQLHELTQRLKREPEDNGPPVY